MVILKNTKNELKELLEKGFLCFIISVQNLALNYDEDNNILDNNLIKVPEFFYNKIFKRSSFSLLEQEINQNKNRKISDDSNKMDDSVRNSFNSFNVTNLDMKIIKTPDKTNANNISSFEDSNYKITEEKKMKDLDLNALTAYKEQQINNQIANKQGNQNKINILFAFFTFLIKFFFYK